MACKTCGPPKTQRVKGYDRAAAPKRRKKAAHKKQGPYWTCVNGRSGRSCGVKHRTQSAAWKHQRRLNLLSFRRGSGRPWDEVKR